MLDFLLGHRGSNFETWEFEGCPDGWPLYMEIPSHVSLKSNLSQRDIDCLVWDVKGVNVQNVAIHDAPECRRVIDIMRRSIYVVGIFKGICVVHSMVYLLSSMSHHETPSRKHLSHFG